jgi:DNA-binding HxlR family transcriptional regulator
VGRITLLDWRRLRSVLGNDYADQVCSVARTLEVVGERWSLLVVRDLTLGLHRFDELVASLGVTRSVLARRLEHLVSEGVVERRAYQDNPPRYEYHLTAKGAELTPVLAVMMHWGDRHYPRPGGPPRVLLHDGCGGAVVQHSTCGACGVELVAADITSVTR